MSWFIPDAFAAGPAGPAAAPEAGGPGFWIIMFAMIVFFYLLAIRPQQKRMKEHRTMLAALAKGDEVVTNGGVLGRVAHIGDNFITLEVAEGVAIKVQKHAVQSVMPKGTIKSVS